MKALPQAPPPPPGSTVTGVVAPGVVIGPAPSDVDTEGPDPMAILEAEAIMAEEPDAKRAKLEASGTVSIASVRLDTSHALLVVYESPFNNIFKAL